MSTTAAQTTTTTTHPGQVAPAPAQEGTSDATTTTTSAVDDEPGLSTSSELALAIGGLLGIAALLVLLTVVYFLKTRPGDTIVGEAAEHDSGDASASDESDGSGGDGGDGEAVGGITALAQLLAENPTGEVPAVETEGVPKPSYGSSDTDEGPSPGNDSPTD